MSCNFYYSHGVVQGLHNRFDNLEKKFQALLDVLGSEAFAKLIAQKIVDSEVKITTNALQEHIPKGDT